MYVNMVRDPVERLVSWFYYVRAAWSVDSKNEKVLKCSGTSWTESRPSPTAPFLHPPGSGKLTTAVSPTHVTRSVNIHRWATDHRQSVFSIKPGYSRAALEGLRITDVRVFSSAAIIEIAFPSIPRGQTNLRSALSRNAMLWYRIFLVLISALVWQFPNKCSSQVGVLEEMNKTLAVLEAFMPRHFRGATEAYWSYASEVNR